jgi:hypothetical protein
MKATSTGGTIVRVNRKEEKKLRKLKIMVAVLAMTLLAAAPAAAHPVLVEPSGHIRVGDVHVFPNGHIMVDDAVHVFPNGTIVVGGS